MKTIYLGCDHAGFDFKEKVKNYLIKKKFDVVDFGTYTYNEYDDYPDFLHPVAQALSQNPQERAIIFGGSGMGESILLNKYNGIRCGVWYGGDKSIIANYREHDDINAIAIASRYVNEDILYDIDVFLSTDFIKEEKYIRRLNKIENKFKTEKGV